MLHLLAGRSGKGLVRRLAMLWGEERRPSYYDAELRGFIDEWASFKGDATKFRAPVRWTPEHLAEMKKYKETHGTAAAAEKYGVSVSLVSAKLATKLPQAKRPRQVLLVSAFRAPAAAEYHGTMLRSPLRKKRAE